MIKCTQKALIVLACLALSSQVSLAGEQDRWSFETGTYAGKTGNAKMFNSEADVESKKTKDGSNYRYSWYQSDFAMGFWYKSDSLPSEGQKAGIFDSFGTKMGYEISINDQGNVELLGKLGVIINSYPAAGPQAWSTKQFTYTSQSKIKAGQWNYIALVVDREGNDDPDNISSADLTNGACKFYIYNDENGIQHTADDTTTFDDWNHNNNANYTSVLNPDRYEDNIYMGKVTDSDGTISYANGLLDEFVFYDHALSEAEIASITGAGVPEPATIGLLVIGAAGILRRKFKN